MSNRLASLEARNAELERKVASYGKLNSALESFDHIREAYETAQKEVQNLRVNVFGETVDVVE